MNEVLYAYERCPACRTSFEKYRRPTPDDQLLVQSFEKKALPEGLYHPAFPNFDLIRRIEYILSQEDLKKYLSKLESLSKLSLSVAPLEVIPPFTRHPRKCATFLIPDSIFSLSLEKSQKKSGRAISSYDFFLLGNEEKSGAIIAVHNLFTIASVNLLGQPPEHL